MSTYFVDHQPHFSRRLIAERMARAWPGLEIIHLLFGTVATLDLTEQQ